MVLSVQENKILVGGQAVIEGVMMRAPKWLAIAVRRPDGEICIKEDRWRSLSERWRVLRWPFFRGALVVLEAVINGMQALTFSANQALEQNEESLSNRALFFTVLLGIAAVLYATGSSARQTVLTDKKPCDAVLMAIVDTWEVGGEVKYQKDA